MKYVEELSVFTELESELEGYKKTLAIAIGDNLIDEMPVDTGRARSNVFISSVEDSRQQISPYAPFPEGSGPNKGESGNRSGAKARLRKSAEFVKPFDDTYIVNNATDEGGDYYYAGDLDAGSSAQTPAGMVDRSITFGIMKADILWGLRR